ncbi:MAG: GLPGLI family protein, partial [Bacteroidetes bacterium]|nr:GLPGLI family protein [Bacteroidota bacterium]
MSRLFILLITITLAASVSAQSNAIFLSHGKIEFEKSVNVYAQMSNEDNGEWNDLMKKASSHFKVSYFDLLFNQNKSLYRPGRETNDKASAIFFFQPPAQDNVVYSDLES